MIVKHREKAVVNAVKRDSAKLTFIVRNIFSDPKHGIKPNKEIRYFLTVYIVILGGFSKPQK